MLLAIDIGNTQVVIGLVDKDGKIVKRFRHPTHKEETIEELKKFFSSIECQSPPFKAIIASTVPSLFPTYFKALKEIWHIPVLDVDRFHELFAQPIVINPSEVGIDRLLNAYAAFHCFKEALLVIDFGTATTFDLVNSKGQYSGGAISPGFSLSSNALFNRAEKLSSIPLKFPSKTIGLDTKECIESGFCYGYACLVQGMIERIKNEAGFPIHTVIATGGDSRLFENRIKDLTHFQPELTILGLWLISKEIGEI